MAWKRNDVYRCSDPACGAEVTVSQPSKQGQVNAPSIVCSCGKPMEAATES